MRKKSYSDLFNKNKSENKWCEDCEHCADYSYYGKLIMSCHLMKLRYRLGGTCLAWKKYDDFFLNICKGTCWEIHNYLDEKVKYLRIRDIHSSNLDRIECVDVVFYDCNFRILIAPGRNPKRSAYEKNFIKTNFEKMIDDKILIEIKDERTQKFQKSRMFRDKIEEFSRTSDEFLF